MILFSVPGGMVRPAWIGTTTIPDFLGCAKVRWLPDFFVAVAPGVWPRAEQSMAANHVSVDTT